MKFLYRAFKQARIIRRREKPLLTMERILSFHLYKELTSFLVTAQPTPSKTALEWIHHFLCLVLLTELGVQIFLLLICVEASFSLCLILFDIRNAPTALSMRKHSKRFTRISSHWETPPSTPALSSNALTKRKQVQGSDTRSGRSIFLVIINPIRSVCATILACELFFYINP